ncbi:MAG: ABC transporter substrate-binding protein, partial [Anaerolineales bacterium]
MAPTLRQRGRRALREDSAWLRSRRTLRLAALACAGLLASCASPAETPQAAMQISIAYPSIADFQDLPSLMALDRLTGDGYTIVPTFFAQPELAVEALASGEADFGFGSSRTYWAGIQQEGRITTIMEQASNGWSIVGLTEIAECAELDGRRLAIGSEGSVAKAMTDAFIQENCPGISPQFLVVPGSENRAAAMLAGQIDAT